MCVVSAEVRDPTWSPHRRGYKLLASSAQAVASSGGPARRRAAAAASCVDAFAIFTTF